MGKELCGKHLTLTSTDIKAVEMLAPAFNGDEQFNLWSGYGSTMSLVVNSMNVGSYTLLVKRSV